MADWYDRAQAREELDRELAISAALSRSRPAGPSRTTCLDCEKQIPAARQALGGITRCVPCQTTFEKGTR